MTCHDALVRRQQLLAQEENMADIYSPLRSNLYPPIQFVAWNKEADDGNSSVIGEAELAEFMDCLLWYPEDLKEAKKVDVFDILEDCDDDTTVSCTSCSSMESDDNVSVTALSIGSTVYLDALDGNEELSPLNPSNLFKEGSFQMEYQLELEDADDEESSTRSSDTNESDGSVSRLDVLVLTASEDTEIEMVASDSSSMFLFDFEDQQAKDTLESSTSMSDPKDDDTHVSLEPVEEANLVVDTQEDADQNDVTSDDLPTESTEQKDENDLVANAVNVAKGIWEGSKETPVGLVVNVTEGVFGHLAGFVHDRLNGDHSEDKEDSLAASPKKYSSQIQIGQEGVELILPNLRDLLESPNNKDVLDEPIGINLLKDDDTESGNQSLALSPRKCQSERHIIFQDEDGCSVSLAASVEDEWIPL